MSSEKTDMISGLLQLVGENVILLGANYFYTGKLTGVDEDEVRLEDPRIVYETGEWRKKDWRDAQELPDKEWFVRIEAIESYGKSGR